MYELNIMEGIKLKVTEFKANLDQKFSRRENMTLCSANLTNLSFMRHTVTPDRQKEKLDWFYE